MSEASRQQRSLPPRQKLEIVLEGLRSESSIADVCRRRGISDTLYYLWRKQLLSSANDIFARPKRNGERREADRLRRENGRLKDVIAEITAENLDLKKSTGR